MKEIPLTQGKVALVDDEDYEWLMQWKWHALKDYSTYYARRSPGISMHRQLLNFPKFEIDHANRNGLDNRRENIRMCSPHQNKMNKNIYKSNKTGYKGVRYRKGEGRFECWINWLSNKKFLGYYLTEQDAARAYNRTSKVLYGKYANYNNVAYKFDRTIKFIMACGDGHKNGVLKKMRSS